MLRRYTFTPMRIRRSATRLALGVLVFLAPGCSKSRTSQSNIFEPDLTASPTLIQAPPPNPIFTPARVRIHPLTRFARPATPGEPARLHAHIELIDPWGLPVRALGVLRLIARFDPAEAARIAGELPEFPGVLVWSIDMSDPDANATRFYDRVTRTYALTLTNDALTLAQRPFTLEAFFDSPAAVALPATARITP